MCLEASDKPRLSAERVGISEASDQKIIGASTQDLADRTKCPCYRSLSAVCYIGGSVDSERPASSLGSKRRSLRMISDPLTFQGGDTDSAAREYQNG